MEGALGVILNRPCGINLGDLTDSPESLKEIPVFEGGPVEQQNVLLAGIQLIEHGTSFETFEQQHANSADNIFPGHRDLRAFTGYAGWSEGQLEEEIRENSWVIIPPTTSLLSAITTPEGKADLEAYFHGREVIDALLEYPAAKFTAEEFVKVLRKLQPRLYSIASSQKANPDSVHLTVAAVRYESNGRKREGVCSTFLADRAETGPVPIFVHSAKHFRVPEDLSTPVIMVGPGTGIAPFRAFLQERKVTGATGKNWLFFGDQKAATDYLYREELESYLAEGVLHELSLAFSRDQAEKIYVQNRMIEQAAELYAWLESGACFYICGDASRMARDVDAALHQVVEKAGGKSPEEAAAYVEELKKSKRYRKDVY